MDKTDAKQEAAKSRSRSRSAAKKSRSRSAPKRSRSRSGSRRRSRSPVRRRSRSRSRSRRATSETDKRKSRSKSRSRGRKSRRSNSRGRGGGRGRSPRRAACGGRKCFVGNLDPLTDEIDLEERFAPYGALEDIYVPRDQNNRTNRGYAFITFVDKRDAEDGCREDGEELRGRRIGVNLAKPRPGGERKAPRTYVPSRDGIQGSLREFTGRGRSGSRSRSRGRGGSRRSRGRRSRSRSHSRGRR